MDDGKRSVLVAALSAYADSLAKNAAQLDVEQGKGKGKASDDYIDLTAEIKDQIEICVELTRRIAVATDGEDIARALETAAPKPLKNIRKSSDTDEKISTKGSTDSSPSTASPKRHTKHTRPHSEHSYFIDNEPYINPFTGLQVIPETGFEAGPSNTSREPSREPPCPPSPPAKRLVAEPPTREPPKSPPPITRSLSLPIKPSSEMPMRPSKPSHLTAAPIEPSPLVSLPALSLPQRSPPSPPQSPRSLQQDGGLPEYTSVSRTVSVKRKPIATTEADMLASHPDPPSENAPSIQLPEPLPIPASPFNWDVDIQPGSGLAGEHGAQLPNVVQKSKYLRYIRQLASKALKTAGEKIKLTRTPSVYHLQHLEQQNNASMSVIFQDHTIEARNVHGQASSTPPFESPQRRISEETLPPAYHTLSRISRRSSWASISSEARTNTTWSPSQAFSSQTSISSVASPGGSSVASPNIGSIAESQQCGIENQIPNRALPLKSTRKRLTRRTTTLPQSSASSSRVSSVSEINFTQGVTPHSTSLPRRTSQHSLSSLLIINEPRPRRNTIQSHNAARSVPNPPLPFDPIVNHQAAANTPTAISPSINSIRNRSPIKVPNSNNPWKYYLETDETLARALQQQEYRELQLERDMLLAYSIANHTADEEDIEVAYYAAQDTADLIDLTDTASTKPMDPFFPPIQDESKPEFDLDWQMARKAEKEFQAADADLEASFAEAKKLQEQFDREAQDDAAWDDWKKVNIKECIVCCDEQHQDELIQPCEHSYCHNCITEGFKEALQSRNPFKCCKKVLNITDCVGVVDLDPQLVSEYEEMMLELSTPNPMYCSNVRCAKFLPPRVIVGDTGTCDTCYTKTCKHCRRKAHPGTFCREDRDTEAVKELAKQKGWKSCPGCNHLIERQSGCLHMVCSRCQTAFCYRCSKPWRDCESSCPDPISATHPKNY